MARQSGTSLIFFLKLHREILVDQEDVAKLGIYFAYISDQGYLKIIISGKPEFFHRVIMDYPEYPVDHLNRVRLDNRKENLKVVSWTENAQNKSGVVGASYCKTRKKWIAYSSGKGGRKNLGGFTNKENAISAYQRALILEKQHG